MQQLVVSVRLVVFEIHEVDEEDGGEEGRLHLHVEVDGKRNGESVGVGEDFLQESAEVLDDFTDFRAVDAQNVELDVSAAEIGANRTSDLQDLLAALVQHAVNGPEQGTLLLEVSGFGAADGDRQLLQAAEAAAPLASQRPVDSHHFHPSVVRHRHLEGPLRTATLPRAAVVFLFGVINQLTQ